PSPQGKAAGLGRVVETCGYRLAMHTGPLTTAALADARVFVTVNAMHDIENLDLPTGNVYSDEEVEPLYTRVHQHGGALFLITDHMPCGGAVSDLAARAGFHLINGCAPRNDGMPE